MLWIERYRPVTFDEIIGQDRATAFLRSFAERRSVPHLLIAGPSGSGRMSAVRCLAQALYADDAGENLTVIASGDLFGEGRTYLEEDERFSHLYRREESLLSNVKRIVRTYAMIRPLNAEYRMMVFLEADVLPAEMQQALRRTMERSSKTCRFVFVTARQSGIITPIASRCFPVTFRPIPIDQMIDHLEGILAREGAVPLPEDDLAMIATASRGDMRRAIMLLELSVRSGRPLRIDAYEQTSAGATACEVIEALEEGDLTQARHLAESLIIDGGLSGREVLLELRKAVRRRWNDPKIAIALATADARLAGGAGEFVQIGALLAGIAEGCR
ncbi:MAG TPA: replication protein C [Methanoregulaceae archaeon]|nr:replication protein C [Methanoregulaceae archaeon]